MKTPKHLIVAVVAVALLICVTAIPVLAGSVTPSVNVSGTLNAACTAGTSGSLSFNIDPSYVGPVSATVTDSTVFCSNGTPFMVTAQSTNAGGSAASCAGAGIQGILTDSGSHSMGYTFTCSVYTSGGVASATNAGTGQGFGTGKDVRLGLGGSIVAISYQNAPAGSTYSDDVILTIAY